MLMGRLMGLLGFDGKAGERESGRAPSVDGGERRGVLEVGHGDEAEAGGRGGEDTNRQPVSALL